jgi:hypothetical protein
MNTNAVVLRDFEGNYYVLPSEVVERARVPEARRAELEAALGGDDVTAYSMTQSIGGSRVTLDGSYLLDEEIEPWPATDPSRGAGLVSAIRMLTGSRF